jgi:hypothetical protein
MTNFELALLVILGVLLLVSIVILVLVFHIGVEGSAIKKKHVETHDKTVEGVNMLVEILKAKK